MAMFTMGNILERAKIPTFNTAAVDPAIANFPRYVFSSNVRIKDEAYHLAQYLYGQGYRRAGVITIQTNFGESGGRLLSPIWSGPEGSSHNDVRPVS